MTKNRESIMGGGWETEIKKKKKTYVKASASGLFQVFFRVFFRSFSGLFQVFFRSFSGLFQVFFRSFSGLFQVFFRSFFQVFFRSFSGLFQVFFRSFSGSIPNSGLTKSLSRIAFKIALLLCINNLEFKMATKISNMADRQTKHNPNA